MKQKNWILQESVNRTPFWIILCWDYVLPYFIFVVYLYVLFFHRRRRHRHVFFLFFFFVMSRCMCYILLFLLVKSHRTNRKRVHIGNSKKNARKYNIKIKKMRYDKKCMGFHRTLHMTLFAVLKVRHTIFAVVVFVVGARNAYICAYIYIINMYCSSFRYCKWAALASIETTITYFVAANEE